ncbi:hypothetical protein BpHYR1_025510 [Brachionus plicatilis]|uniref:Uncharacterized protein n=1 Tax=Brachionus plicatilis TaxID=10195 RepID=A0A3M7SY02_BRAPC|nr:hypothetical protein BpHYR1_025510 [Brachionus plicatilis]
MDSILYREILSHFLIPFGASKFDFEFNLHQDNDPKYNSMMCSSFLDLNNIKMVIGLTIKTLAISCFLLKFTFFYLKLPFYNKKLLFLLKSLYRSSTV